MHHGTQWDTEQIYREDKSTLQLMIGLDCKAPMEDVVLLYLISVIFKGQILNLSHVD